MKKKKRRDKKPIKLNQFKIYLCIANIKLNASQTQTQTGNDNVSSLRIDKSSQRTPNRSNYCSTTYRNCAYMYRDTDVNAMSMNLTQFAFM